VHQAADEGGNVCNSACSLNASTYTNAASKQHESSGQYFPEQTEGATEGLRVAQIP